MLFADLLKFIPIPYGVLALAFLGCVIVGTLFIIDRRELNAVQAIGLLLLVWAIPIFGFLAAMGYVLFVVPRRA